MARLCIRILPNPNAAEPALDVLRTQEGDVVCIVDDDHKFSFGEENCGQYRFIDVPGVSQGDLIHLVEHEEDADGTMLQRRKRSLDKTVLRDDEWKDRKVATREQIESIVRVKVQRGR